MVGAARALGGLVLLSTPSRGRPAQAFLPQDSEGVASVTY